MKNYIRFIHFWFTITINLILLSLSFLWHDISHLNQLWNSGDFTSYYVIQGITLWYFVTITFLCGYFYGYIRIKIEYEYNKHLSYKDVVS